VAAGILRHCARQRHRRLGAGAGGFCGLYGIRPTHGRIDVTGMLPSGADLRYDGWFARDAATLRGLRGDAGRGHPDGVPTRLIVAVDAFGFADAE